ncbi:MAG: hypothetical protein JWO97_1147 [Acidobacteria bacterium]|nr:hypothetical protein [Acidobacteriota bacterium]
MSTLLCTSKYRALFHLPNDLASSADEPNGSLGPWYANTLSIGPQRYIHYMSSRTLLPIVIWLRESHSAESRMRDTLRDLLSHLGIAEHVANQELEAMASFTYARATDRSRLASMRDQLITAKHVVRGGRASSPWDITIDLARMPLGVLNFQTSREFTKEVLGVKVHR